MGLKNGGAAGLLAGNARGSWKSVSAPLLGSKRMDFGCDGDYNQDAMARALRGGAGV